VLDVTELFYTTSDLLALLIVFTGGALQTTVGIGFGLLAAPLLFLLEPDFVPGPILLLAGLLSLMVVLRQREQLRWNRVLPAIVWRFPGAWCGAWLLVNLPTQQLGLFFGLSLLAAVVLSWQMIAIPLNRLSLSIGGFMSGLFGTATSVGGPPIAMVYMEEKRTTARNEIAAFFLIGTPISILMLIAQGGFGLLEVAMTVKMLPALLLGWWFGIRLDRLIQPGTAKPAILAVSLLSALAVIVDALITN